MRRLLPLVLPALAVAVLLAPFPQESASASCAAPSLHTGWDRVHAGERIVLRGEAFVSGCDDTGGQSSGAFGCSVTERADTESPMRHIRLQLRQQGRHWSLGTVESSGRGGGFSRAVRIPAAVHAGTAMLIARTGDYPARLRVIVAEPR